MVKRTMLFVGFAVLAASSSVFAQVWGRSTFPRDGVCFFKDPNFRGDYFCVRSGDNVGAMPDGMNDKISSIKVFGNAEVTLFRDVRFSGNSSRFDYDVPKLKDVGWNDLVSSVRVRSSSGGGGYRPPSGGGYPGSGYGRPGDVDQIVRRAYRDILDREPDAQGMRLYRSHMLDDGWSESRVRETLRNSPEYREKSTMTVDKAQEIVRRAYESVLKREPDAGASGYVNRVMRDHWTQQDVERELRKSDEYRNKRR